MENVNRRNKVQARPVINERVYSKNNNSKMD
jgi:hypothetical protein